MDWHIVLPRFAAELAPGARLAIVDDPESPEPWADDLRPILARHSTIRQWHQFALIPELERLGLFERVGIAVGAGLLVTSAGPTTLRLTPPLTVTHEEVAQAISILQEVQL